MQINYESRICDDKEKIYNFLKIARTGILALNAGEYPYAVPVNFVYIDNCIYFHGMGSGKKYDLIEESPAVSFVVYSEEGTVKDKMPCHSDTAYFSVMLFGQAEIIKDSIETSKILQTLVEKYMPDFYKTILTPKLMENYRSSRDKMPTAVYKINIHEITAKQNIAAPEDLY